MPNIDKEKAKHAEHTWVFRGVRKYARWSDRDGLIVWV